MNLLVLLIGLRVWASRSPLELLTGLFAAVSLISFELQVATWTGAATLPRLVPVNAAIAALLLAASSWRPLAVPAAATDRLPARAGLISVAPWLAPAALGVLVLALNLALPLEAADPYHLQRVERIERIGTLAYDPEAPDPKVNVFGWLYELVLADLRLMPLVGEWVVRLHGVVGLALFTLTGAAALQLVGGSSPLAVGPLVLMPAAFHQFVLVKNDLFGAMPAALAIAWMVARVGVAGPRETAWAGWLCGLAVAIKLSSAPVMAVYAAVLLIERRDRRVLAAAAAGAAVGLATGGFFFTLIENARLYGAGLAPYASLGNRTAGVADAASSAVRFALSLVDLGLVTRRVWPGRGGWGSTYGLPVIWAGAVTIASARESRTARRTLWICSAYWLLFALAYPDADLAHRLALSPAVVLVVVGAGVEAGNPAVPAWLRRLEMPVVVLSAGQILRSALLYVVRA